MSQKGFVLLVGSDGLGRGDEELGRLLMHRFLHELGSASTKPETALFINTGVKLVADDSPVLGQLKRLEETGVELLACSTCLERFGLMERVAVGSRTNMGHIVAALTAATKVVSV
jgi:selenium metabolism protein YedF